MLVCLPVVIYLVLKLTEKYRNYGNFKYIGGVLTLACNETKIYWYSLKPVVIYLVLKLTETPQEFWKF